VEPVVGQVLSRYRATVEVYHEVHGYGQIMLGEVPEKTRLLFQNHHLLVSGGDVRQVDLRSGQWVDAVVDTRTGQVQQVTAPHGAPLSIRPYQVFPSPSVYVVAPPTTVSSYSSPQQQFFQPQQVQPQQQQQQQLQPYPSAPQTYGVPQMPNSEITLEQRLHALQQRLMQSTPIQPPSGAAVHAMHPSQQPATEPRSNVSTEEIKTWLQSYLDKKTTAS